MRRYLDLATTRRGVYCGKVADVSTASTSNPWVVASSEEYGAKAAVTIPYRLDPPGRPADLVFEGVCPRCDHAFVYRWPLEIVRGVSTTTVTVSCQCKQAHQGRPERVDGCGAYWNVVVPAP